MNFDNLKPEVTASEENSSRDERNLKIYAI
jgi:hypothetical protein